MHPGEATAPRPTSPRGLLGLFRRFVAGHGLELMLAFGLSLLFLRINPFGHITALEHYGRDLFNQLFAPAVYETGWRDRLAVVLLRDNDLDEAALPWPAPYAYHAGVLAELRALKPAAVMVDFLFIDDKRRDDTLTALAEEIREYRNAGIPLFLASPPPGFDTPRVIDRLEESGARLVPVPRLVGSGGDHAYALFDCRPSAGIEACRASAAASLYREVCGAATAPRWPCDAALVRAIQQEHPAPGAEHMEVFWSMAPVTRSDGHPACEPPPAAFLRRFLRVFGNGDALRLGCPTIPTLGPTRLLHQAAGDGAALRRLLERRVVFYGADILGGTDVIRPASHERLAGVYLHAMAVDNLLTFGARYKREVGRFGLTPHTVQGFVLFLLVVPLLWLFLTGQDRLFARWHPRLAARMFVTGAFKVGYVLVATGLVLAIAWLEFRWLDLVPGNWLEGALEAIVAKHFGVNVSPFIRSLPGLGVEPAAR